MVKMSRRGEMDVCQDMVVVGGLFLQQGGLQGPLIIGGGTFMKINKTWIKTQ